MISPRIGVKGYLSAYLFLQDIYQFRKANERSFSYDIWARELGLSSKSSLRLVVMGRKSITPELQSRLIVNLNLKAEDEAYFSHLVLYTQAKTRHEREAHGKKLAELLRPGIDPMEIKDTEFVQSKLIPRIQTLMSFKEVNQNPKMICTLLDITESELSKALRFLTEKGLINPQLVQDKVHFVLPKESFVLPDRPKDEALTRFHNQSLEEAIKAQSLPAEIRRYRSLLVPLTPEEYVEFCDEMNSFCKSLLVRFNRDSLLNRRLYQINMNAIPVTERLADVTF